MYRRSTMRDREHRARVYRRAAAIARDVRTADFTDAVNIVAKLIAGSMTRRSHEPSARDHRVGPERWKCKRCGEARRRSECLICGNQEPITDEARVSGLAY